jgi:segregation and condensation protein B
MNTSMQPDLRNIIESLLFVADEPLAVDKLKSILETVDGREIRAALERLREEYDQRGGGFGLSEIAGGWQLRSRPQYQEWIKRLLQPSPQRLSRAALETLALIAYRQPIIRADIEHVRGVDCGGVLRQLMERKLIRVLGRREIPGRPLIYATTRTFLELFDLKDLKDLPSPREIQELGNAFAGAPNRTSEETAESVAGTPLQDETQPAMPEPEPYSDRDEPAETLAHENDASTVSPAETETDPAFNPSDSSPLNSRFSDDEEPHDPGP